MAGRDRRAAEQAAGSDAPVRVQVPIAVLLTVTSTTDVFPNALLMSVPDGNVTVIVLTAWRDSAARWATTC